MNRLLSLLLLAPLTLPALVSTARAESAVSSADLALVFDPASVEVAQPSVTGTTKLILSHQGGFAFSPIDVTVQLDTALEVDVVSATAPGGTSFSNGLWTITGMTEGESLELELGLRGGTGGYFPVTAEIATASVEDPDSYPGDGDPCDDDFAWMLFTTGFEDAGAPLPPDCDPPAAADAGPPIPTADGGIAQDADPHPGYDEGGGCAAAGGGADLALLPLLGLIAVAARRRRTR